MKSRGAFLVVLALSAGLLVFQYQPKAELPAEFPRELEASGTGGLEVEPEGELFRELQNAEEHFPDRWEPDQFLSKLPSRREVLRELGDGHSLPPSLERATLELAELLAHSQSSPQKAATTFEIFRQCALSLDLMPSLNAEWYFNAVTLGAGFLNQPEALSVLRAQLTAETLELVEQYETLAP